MIDTTERTTNQPGIDLPTSQLVGSSLAASKAEDSTKGSADEKAAGSQRGEPVEKSLTTAPLTDNLLSLETGLVRAGMGRHAAPPRIVPTLGARIAGGLQRATLLVVILALSGGVLAAGGYALASTSWLSSIFSPARLAAQTNPAVQSQQANGAGGTVKTVDPAQARNLRDQGVAEYKAGNFERGITLLEQSVSMEGDDAIAYYQLGLAYMAAAGREHALDDAEMAFRTAASLQPSWAAPYQGLAESLLRRNFNTQAIEPALKATQLSPDSPEAWMTLGRVYRAAGQDKDATQAYAEAVRLAPPPPVR